MNRRQRFEEALFKLLDQGIGCMPYVIIAAIILLTIVNLRGCHAQ